MDEEKFADNGEFQGAGVPKKTEAPSPETGMEAPEAGAQSQAGQVAGGNASPAETPDSPDAGNEPDERAKPGAEKADPLDLPIEDFAKVDLGLGDAPVDKTVMEAYGQMCVDLKLSPRQAASLAQFQMKAVAEARERLAAEALKELDKAWGKDGPANQFKINSLVDQADAAIGGGFRDALETSGVTCDANFAKGLLALAEMIHEDNLGANSRPAPQDKPETALEGLTALFAKAKSKE